MRENVHVGVPNYNLITDEGTISGPHLGAYLGAASNPFQIGANFVTSEFKVQNLSLSSEMETQLENRIRLLREFDEMRRELDTVGDMQGMDAFNQLAVDMLTNDRSRGGSTWPERTTAPAIVTAAMLGASGHCSPAGWSRPGAVSSRSKWATRRRASRSRPTRFTTGTPTRSVRTISPIAAGRCLITIRRLRPWWKTSPRAAWTRRSCWS